ncbi:MAG: hypothetical protein JRN23_03995, partial [Nitrososphaerota archaeon]|nr:hypothetical protein [Nitrososphaerota archaeon]
TVVRSMANASTTDRRATTELSRLARKTMFGGGVIADSKEVVLLLGGGGSGEAASSPLAIWADHPGLASFARDYFEFLWDSRETVKQQAVGPRPGGRPGQGL